MVARAGGAGAGEKGEGSTTIELKERDLWFAWGNVSNQKSNSAG